MYIILSIFELETGQSYYIRAKNTYLYFMNFSIVSECAINVHKMDSINYGTLYVYAFINK